VNDPYSYGRIAAANSISDVYTMGGRPITALNVVCFPSDKMEMTVLREILRGGLDAMNEAGVALLGGHSVKDNETKYGLAVTGLVHPDKLVTNSGAQVGDYLVLTKPLGTGILSTALKNRHLDDAAFQPVVESMRTLNRIAAGLMLKAGVHSCTDITGFGLAGHASHLIQEGGIGIEFDFPALPVFAGAMEFLQKKVYPGGLEKNRDFYGPLVEFKGTIPESQRGILFDPQTSGGLLIALPPGVAERLVVKLKKRGIERAAVVGRVVRSPGKKITVR
jgi:selenide, water dikinase